MVIQMAIMTLVERQEANDYTRERGFCFLKQKPLRLENSSSSFRLLLKPLFTASKEKPTKSGGNLTEKSPLAELYTAS